MKRNFARLIPVLAFVLVTMLASAQTGTAAAAPAGPSKVGIINIQGAIVTTNEGQRDFQALQKKFEPKRTELETLGKDVDELKKRLSAQGDKLNDEARAQLVREVDSKQKLLQRNYEDANNDLQAQQNEIANRIGQKMMAVLDKYAKGNEYTVILDVSGQGSPVLWAGESADITQAIIEAYNVQSGVPPQPKPAGAPGAAAPKPAGTPARPATTPARPATTAPKPTTPK
jgi:outer membrane protein